MIESQEAENSTESMLNWNLSNDLSTLLPGIPEELRNIMRKLKLIKDKSGFLFKLFLILRYYGIISRLSFSAIFGLFIVLYNMSTEKHLELYIMAMGILILSALHSIFLTIFHISHDVVYSSGITHKWLFASKISYLANLLIIM